MIGYLEMGAKIYNNNRLSDYRRMSVFIIRSLINHDSMQDINKFFRLNSLRVEIVAKHPYLFEQVTRSIFYRRSSFSERIALIKEHFLFFENKFKQEGLRHIFLGEGLEVWSSEYQGERISLILQFEEIQKKEGLMGITLKIGAQKVYKVIFWVAKNQDGEAVINIGALQGSREGAEINRDLTKHFFGYRPKNLMLHALRSFARHLSISRIYAVSNYGFYANNHIRLERKLKTSLDDFWNETGGTLCSDPRFYELPLIEPRKGLEEVQSHKRNLYRKRFATLDNMEEEVQQSLLLYTEKI